MHYMKANNFIKKVSRLNEMIKTLIKPNKENYELISLNTEIELLIKQLFNEDNDNLSALIKIEERFRKLFEDSADATLIIEDNRFIDCNKATLRMLKMDTKEQVFNTHPSALSPKRQPDNKLSMEKAEEMMKIALEFGSNRFEWVHKRADGELFYAEVLLTRISQNNKQFLYCVWREITNRKKAEKALKASEESYKFLFEQAADGILVGNEKGIIINANKNISKISGYSIDELLGNYINILFPPQVLKSKPLRYDLVKAGDTVLMERQMQKKDGSIIIIEMNTKKINDGRLQAYIRDITARKNDEQRIINKNIELETTKNKLKESNSEFLILNTLLKKQKKELEIAKEKAEESDMLKSAFLANMSHEIRTPMNGILGFAELLRERNLKGDKQAMYLNVIEQSGHRMLDIMNNLIDISKIEAGQISMHYEHTDVNKLLKNLFDFFLPEAQKKNISLLCKPYQTDNMNLVCTDRTKLSQIISNLVKNAIKFTDNGIVDFGCIVENNKLNFYVKDNGIGIESGYSNEIFHRFRQVNSNNENNYEGAGLGLSISKAFVEALGGKIWFESKINVGSTFYFTIPLRLNLPK